LSRCWDQQGFAQQFDYRATPFQNVLRLQGGTIKQYAVVDVEIFPNNVLCCIPWASHVRARKCFGRCTTHLVCKCCLLQIVRIERRIDSWHVHVMLRSCCCWHLRVHTRGGERHILCFLNTSVLSSCLDLTGEAEFSGLGIFSSQIAGKSCDITHMLFAYTILKPFKNACTLLGKWQLNRSWSMVGLRHLGFG
jgi:hypothetical protein